MRMLLCSSPTSSPNASYLFNCSVIDTNNKVGWGTFQLDVALAPTSGTMTVTPSIGEAAVDFFTISMDGWTTLPNDFPLTYSFAFDYSPTGSVQYTRSPSTAIQSTMPQPIQQNVVNVVGTVYGASGQLSTLIQPLSVSSCIPTSLADIQHLLNLYGTYKAAFEQVVITQICVPTS